MKTKKHPLEELLTAWEETYKKGQLTLWIFLALKDGKKFMEEIKVFIETESHNAMQCEEQSIYRNLRKFQHINIVDFETGKGNKGPERKYYYLTPLGEDLLEQFVERNIRLFFKPKIVNLLKTAS
jgi:PadR family transcriptional regulator, regulatory protein PadR